MLHGGMIFSISAVRDFAHDSVVIASGLTKVENEGVEAIEVKVSKIWSGYIYRVSWLRRK